MKRIGVLCIALSLAGCGSGSTDQTDNSGAAGPSNTSVDVAQADDQGPKPEFTLAQSRACMRQYPKISPEAQRGMIANGETWTDEDIQKVEDDADTHFVWAPESDGTCDRIIATANTIVNGNQIKYIRICKVKDFDKSDPEGPVPDWVSDCEPFRGVLPQ